MKLLRAQAMRKRLGGYSYNEIQASLGIPKSTLSGWFKHIVLSERARKRLAARARLGSAFLIKRNKMQTHAAAQRARTTRQTGAALIGKFSKRELMLLGASLYWAEGHKRLIVRAGKERTSHTIRFVNADADMVRMFIFFLFKILDIPQDDIRLSMRLYPHINETEAREYWARASGLQNPRFFKTTFLVSGASKGIRPYNRLPWGTLQVEVCDTHKFHHLMGLIEGVKKQISHATIIALPG